MEIISIIIILVAIGVALFNRGAKLGVETYILKEEVNAFQKKYSLSINWYSSIPHKTIEMLWIAYSYPDNDYVSYEVHHTLGFHRVLKEFDSLKVNYVWDYFQFQELIYFKNAQELISYKNQKSQEYSEFKKIGNHNKDSKESDEENLIVNTGAFNYTNGTLSMTNLDEFHKQMESNQNNFKPLSPEEMEKRRVPIHCNPPKPFPTQDNLVVDKFSPPSQVNVSEQEMLTKHCPFCGGGIVKKSRLCRKCGTGFPDEPNSDL